MRYSHLLFLFFILFNPVRAFADRFVTSANDGFTYSGRVAYTEQGAFLSWPGNSVTFSFSGNKLVLTLDDQTGRNYYNVIFDGQDISPYVIHTQRGLHQYDLSHMVRNDTTQVTLFKRTEGEEGGTYFQGVTLADDGKMLAKPVPPSRRILFYGDSITVGMGNEAAHNDPDNKPSEKNHYLSYAAITARHLNAEFHSIAKSGIGFMVSWFDFTMPEYYDQLTAESNNNSSWHFDDWQPDVVVVNLGQNDRWLIENERRLNAGPEEIKKSYEEFIRTLMKHHPDAEFVCAIGSMDATKTSVWPDYIASAVDAIKASPDSSGDGQRVHTLVFDFTGYGAHPRVEQHRENAAKLTDYLKEMMNW